MLAPDQIVSGRYRIVRFLNRGGMGEVYEAEDLELHEHVALKTLLPEIAGNATSIAGFKQEIQLSRKVTHPNVCRVFDLARDPADSSAPDTVYFLTMEFLPGETLEARLRREGRMNPEEAFPLLEAMAAALDAAHQSGIIHRDFKPANVMLVPGSGGLRPVVTDFGLARSNAPPDTGAVTETMTGHIMGTPGYVAPEVLAGANASASSDIYALAVSAYRMIAGGLPPSPEVRLPGIDGRWERAIQRGLHWDPAQRFRSATEFVETIQGTTPAGLLRHRRMITAAVAILLLAAAAWLGWSGWERRRMQPPAEVADLYRNGVDDLHAGSYFAASKVLQQATQLAPHYSLSHARLAEAWLELELYEKAAVEMLLARQEGTSGISEADRLRIDAVGLSITRDFDGAAEKYRQILAIAGAEKADTYLDLGRTYERAEQIPKALENYQKAVELAPRNPAAWLRLAFLHSRGAQSRALAQDEFRKAEELFQVTSNMEGLTEVAYERSVDANRRGDVKENAAQAQKAFETARFTGNVHQQIRATLQLGSAAFFAGDAAQAEKYAQQAIGTARANHIDSLAIRGVIGMGDACLQNRDFGGAEKYYDEALAAARAEKTRWLASRALLVLANLHFILKRPNEALSEAREALDFYQPSRFAKESIQCLTLIGRVQRDGGDPAALGSFQAAVEIAQSSKDPLLMALAHENLGRLFEVQEQLPEALKHYGQELELSAGTQHYGWAAYQCGQALWQLGRFAESETMLEKAEADAAKFADLRLAITISRAEAALSKRKFEDAAGLCRGVLASNPGPGDAAHVTALLCRAQIGSGHGIEGRRTCEAALSASERLGDLPLRREAQLTAAEARLGTGDRAGALALIHELEQSAAALPIFYWRILVLAGRTDRVKSREYAVRANKQLDVIEHDWGPAAFQGYLQRPDVQALRRAAR